MKQYILMVLALWLICGGVQAQIDSGSNGSDGAFNPTDNIVIDMTDHPDGIYHYTSVNIPGGVTVTFIPNPNNTPVVWLAQSNCVIAGILSVKGIDTTDSVVGANGGPGGWRGGNGALSPGLLPESGLGPGGGKVGMDITWNGGNGSYSTLGDCNTNSQPYSDSGWIFYPTPQYLPGDMYGNTFELPLLGGSGGSGGQSALGGGGGGGAILIVVSGTLTVSGSIWASGGNGYYSYRDNNGNTWKNGAGGAGSGGAIRLIASSLTGSGYLDTRGGSAVYGSGSYQNGYSYTYLLNSAGNGRIRLEGFSDTFTGSTVGATTRGFTGIIFLPINQQPRLVISSIVGQSISSNPTGALATPDALISAQQTNPIPLVVNCSNIPLNTQITVRVNPASGATVSATGYNTTGTVASSTATIPINMPRGGGLIYATAATGN